MRKIDKPNFVAADVYTICVDMVRSVELKNRLRACVALITQATEEFDLKITKGQMHTIAREETVNGNVTCDELVGVYTGRMATKDAKGRWIYDKLLLSAPGGICPFCNQREATTLDHYLPKTKYPRLSVATVNLVPCCKDCNDEKDAFYPTLPNEEILHPYFDDIMNEEWLDAKIIQTKPCSFEYFVNPPGHWPPLLQERIKFHFEKLKLAKLYTTHAAVELSGIRYLLKKHLTDIGRAAVKKYLEENAASKADYLMNSWQAAFYRAAMNDDWFIDGGFE